MNPVTIWMCIRHDSQNAIDWPTSIWNGTVDFVRNNLHKRRVCSITLSPNGVNSRYTFSALCLSGHWADLRPSTTSQLCKLFFSSSFISHTDLNFICSACGRWRDILKPNWIFESLLHSADALSTCYFIKLMSRSEYWLLLPSSVCHVIVSCWEHRCGRELVVPSTNYKMCCVVAKAIRS